MKKLLLTLLTTVISATTLTARDTDISISYGAIPSMNNLGVYRNHWNDINSWGALNIGFDHQFAPNLHIGLTYTYSSASSNNAYQSRYGKITWHGILASLRYSWLQRGIVKLYSHVGIGALVEYYSPSWIDSYNRTNMAFQVSPIGAEINLAPWASVFAEAGYGVQGIIQAGLRVGF